MYREQASDGGGRRERDDCPPGKYAAGTVPRFYAPPDAFDAGSARLTGDDAAHIKNALRMRVGGVVALFDGLGYDYRCELTEVRAGEATARVVERTPSVGEPFVRVTLWQSLPRSDKFDWIVQKCVEAGVAAVVPVFSERTQAGVAKSAESAERRLTRWRRIAYEAAKQSGRGIVPEVAEPVCFDDAIGICAERVSDAPRSRLAIIPYECERDRTLKAALSRRIAAAPTELHVFIGPEGGFTPEEAETAAECGILPVTLGPRIFRTETAGLAVVCAAMYEYEM